MPYRRTEKVARKLAARHAAILAAARALAEEGGLAAVQIAPVAARAAIAAGTVYRYFPAKTDLVTALAGALAEADGAVLAKSAAAAPGPFSALAAAIAAYAAHALAHRRLAFALLAEPVEPELDAARAPYRQAIVALERRIAAALAGGHLPDQDTALSARAVLGAVIEGLIGQLAPPARDGAQARVQVQTLTLLSLRALGVADARARGLVVQVAVPNFAI